MKHIYQILLASLFIVTFYSCDDFLDVKPQDEVVPTTYEDFALLLNNPSLKLQYVLGYTSLFTDDVEKVDDPTFPVAAGFNETPEYAINMYNFKSGDIFPEGEDENDPFFQNTYSHIFTYNAVANNIIDAIDGSDEEKLITRAEALFGRAYSYFKLVTLYGKAYDAATASTDYGVPIILTEDINATYVRNSVEEVYNHIIKDLQEAVPLLEVNATNQYHTNRISGYLLLSKVYLFKGDYINALKYAEIALDNKSIFELQDLKEYTTVNKGYRQRIVDITTGQPMEAVEDILENISIYVSGNDLSNASLASQDLMDTYAINLPSGSVDMREHLYFAKNSVNIGTGINFLFPGYSLYVAYTQRNPGMLLSDLYLILAETEARIGSKDKALEYLDHLRDYRITDNVPLSATTNKEALNIVLDERRREFSFLSDFRFQDLKRLNTEPDFAKDLVHNFAGVTYNMPANDPRYILPLSRDVVKFNPDIPQYER
jgi:tetratricopeptide (TPR) repeat protein